MGPGAAGPATDTGVRLHDLVDTVLRQPEQDGVGTGEQCGVTGVRAAAYQFGGHRDAVAAFVEGVQRLSVGQPVEGLKPDVLVHQHTFIIGNAGHSRVTPCYSQENPVRWVRSAGDPGSVPFGCEALPRPLDLGLRVGAADEIRRLHVLSGFEVLVMHEEVLDRGEFVLGNVG